MAITNTYRAADHRTRGDTSRPLATLRSTIWIVARTAAIIAALLLVAFSPIVLRLWLFFPSIHS
ncbi:MAG TPA: hypothetical protein VHT04_16525 [Stellaceae bacterium]|jgi:hypothetical protein|nr:hypothetical protein [Stellaceae bacterium]